MFKQDAIKIGTISGKLGNNMSKEKKAKREARGIIPLNDKAVDAIIGNSIAIFYVFSILCIKTNKFVFFRLRLFNVQRERLESGKQGRGQKVDIRGDI